MHEHEKGENLSDHQRRMCQRPAARTLKIQPGGTARRYGGQRFRMGSTPVALRQHAGVVQGIIRSDGPERRAHWVRFRLHDASGGGERRQRRTGYLKKIYTFRRTMLPRPRFYMRRVARIWCRDHAPEYAAVSQRKRAGNNRSGNAGSNPAGGASETKRDLHKSGKE